MKHALNIPIGRKGSTIREIWVRLPQDGSITNAEWEQFLTTLEAMRPALVQDSETSPIIGVATGGAKSGTFVRASEGITINTTGKPSPAVPDRYSAPIGTPLRQTQQGAEPEPWTTPRRSTFLAGVGTEEDPHVFGVDPDQSMFPATYRGQRIRLDKPETNQRYSPRPGASYDVRDCGNPSSHPSHYWQFHGVHKMFHCSGEAWLVPQDEDKPF